MLLDKGYVEAYTVIDMLCPCSVPKAWQDDNLWHVSFSDDILVATVRSADACHSNTLRLKQVELLHCFAAEYEVHIHTAECGFLQCAS